MLRMAVLVCMLIGSTWGLLYPDTPTNPCLCSVFSYLSVCYVWSDISLLFCIFRSTLNPKEIIPLTVIGVTNIFSPRLLYVSWFCPCFCVAGWFSKSFGIFWKLVFIFGFHTLNLSWKVLPHLKIIKGFIIFSSYSLMVSFFAFKYLIYFEHSDIFYEI